jgi:hypothetical protein
MIASNLFDQLGVIVALPGAKCRHKHHLFDGAEPGEDPDSAAARHNQALGLCHHCPALDRCRDWFDSLPPPETTRRGLRGPNQPETGPTSTPTESSHRMTDNQLRDPKSRSHEDCFVSAEKPFCWHGCPLHGWQHSQAET